MSSKPARTEGNSLYDRISVEKTDLNIWCIRWSPAMQDPFASFPRIGLKFGFADIPTLSIVKKISIVTERKSSWSKVVATHLVSEKMLEIFKYLNRSTLRIRPLQCILWLYVDNANSFRHHVRSPLKNYLMLGNIKIYSEHVR